MNYTPLITAADFVGPRADVMATVTGLLTIILIIAVAGMIWKVLSH